jgi:hypothetical protein
VYDFVIVVDSAAVTAKFYINGSQVGTTITTNIPTSTDQNTPTMGAGIGAANAGSGAISYSVDAISVYKTLTTARTMYKP